LGNIIDYVKRKLAEVVLAKS